MIGVDTNVLIRHLVKDDPQNAERARRFLDARSPDDPAFISTTVVIETIYVLSRKYGVGRAEIVRVLETLLRSRDILIQSAASLRRALADAEEANTDLADAIIAHSAIDAGCDWTVTLDRRAQRLPGMLPVA
jgi:predicted nucleic-acid-binding protein